MHRLFLVSKINNMLTDNAEDFYIVMPMYNLLEYRKNYSKITRSWTETNRDEQRWTK